MLVRACQNSLDRHGILIGDQWIPTGRTVKVDIPIDEEYWKKTSLMDKWREHYKQAQENPDKRQTAFKCTAAILTFQAPSAIYVFFNYIIPYLFEDYDYWTQYTLKVIFVYIWIQEFLNYWMCYFYDTSIKKTRDNPDLPGLNQGWNHPPDHFTSRIDGLAENGHIPNGHVTDDGFELKWCDKCEIFKPLRTHHCKICKKCVLMRDHHCYIVGTCIGYKNQRYFVVLTFYTVLVGLLFGYFQYRYLNLVYWPNATSWTDFVLPVTCYRWFMGTIPYRYNLMIYHLYIELFFGLVGFFFFTLQLSLIAKGKTMYEVAKEVPVRVSTSINSHFVSVFGNLWALNFIFPMQLILKQNGDGTKWNGVKIDRNSNYQDADLCRP
ncbi:hypothetical protein FSP39_020027 [Pinctada imbricata]|uniref:Palmitoyltransferase n=1 Tax=Pinctada imbricata TaxID=66713 RepID=A0AA88YIY2_PINIB|nr:hypothetical protein FSP39_020027 [Pinctada imbricata]